MADTFQRLFTHTEPQVFSVNVQAALGPVREPRRSQFTWLMRHFVERFFNHETASPDGDAKTRMVQIACAAGLPPFAVAVYLWPVYHPIKGWPPGDPSNGGPPPYWLQVNHHLFFILYSLIALGIATVFEWDLFFPDLLDLFVLGTLPIVPRRVFLARVAAIGLFAGGLLVDVNLLATFILPMSMDPPNLPRFLLGHMLATAMAGIFSAASILALQGVLLSVFGENLFRRIALVLQGSIITLLVMMMLLFPVLSGIVPSLLESQNIVVRCLPPFWFLGLDQQLLEGPGTLPIYSSLAQTGCLMTTLAAGLALLTYPLAYARRIRELVEGSPSQARGHMILRPLHWVLQASVIRPPVRRAVFHFISRTILRVPRYRIYLVLYCGVGLSVVTATILRFTATGGKVLVGVSADGIRVAIGIVIFWMIAGLRLAFVSSGNQRGRWIFRIVHGNPPEFPTMMEHLDAARVWVLVCCGAVTSLAWLVFRAISPPELLTWPATAAQALTAAAMCVLLTDGFFINVTTIAFTGDTARTQANLAFTVLKYFAFFPLVTALPLRLEPVMEHGIRGFLGFAFLSTGVHLYLRYRQRRIVYEHCNQLALEDDEEDFPMKLGLRY